MVATPRGGRPGLSPDARALVEEYVRELARAGRLRDLPRSRGDLAAHYRAQGDDAASYCLAVAPDFSLTETAAGDVLMRLRRSGHLVSWTRSELLDQASRPSEGENCAKQLPPGPDRCQGMSDGERRALAAPAEEEAVRRQQGS